MNPSHSKKVIGTAIGGQIDSTTELQPNSIQETSQKKLLVWLEEHGAILPSPGAQPQTAYSSTVTKRTIMRGALVAHLPRSVIITANIARTSAIGMQLSKHSADIGDYAYLAIFLLNETKDPTSIWKPYIDTIPREFPDHPLFFAHAEIESLQDWRSLAILSEQKKKMIDDFQQISACLQEPLAYSCAEFARAYCAVITRAISLQMDGKNTVGLVPLIETFIIPGKSNAKNWTDANYGLGIVATECIEEGNNISIALGTHSNAHIFFKHGFCPDLNTHNFVEIDIPSLLESHPVYRLVKSLGEERDGFRTFKVTAHWEDPSVHTLFSYLRLACLEDAPNLLRFWTSYPNTKADQVPPISRISEIAVLLALRSACIRVLNKYKTSYQDDMLFLQSHSHPTYSRQITKVQLSEKLICQSFLDLCDVAVPILQNTEKKIADSIVSNEKFTNYLSSLSKFLD